MALKYSRIMLKISGEALAGERVLVLTRKYSIISVQKSKKPMIWVLISA